MKKNCTNQLFETSFRENWDREALSDYDGKTLHYRDIAATIAKLHILFSEYKIKRGDKIALCGRNQANWGVVFLASFTYGAIIVPILHEFKPDNIHYIVNHSDSRLLFVSSSIWENIDASTMPNIEAVLCLKDLSVLHHTNDDILKVLNNLDSIFDKKYRTGYLPENISYHKDKPNELCIISYTSGTMGTSKGVMIPYRAISSNVLFAQESLPFFGNTDRLVSMLPMAHMYGLMFEFLFEMSVGAHVHFLNRLPTPKIIIAAFANIRPTLIISVPLIIEKIYKKQLQPILAKTTIKMLLKLPFIDRLLLSKISNTLNNTFGGQFIEVIVGGAAFSKEAEQFFKRINFRYTVGYGMTECAPIITYSFWSEVKLYSVGKVVKRMAVKIDSDLPESISGEILVKGDNVFLGYYKNEEATKNAFTDDGWLKTGDMGIIDKEGYLFINGRCKNMILGPSGQNIYPEEIEDIINNKPYILESLVIEHNGKLIALIYPDYDTAIIDGIKEQDIPNLIDKTLTTINNELPKYSQISRIKLQTEEFIKTPKRSIKRFLYTIDE